MPLAHEDRRKPVGGLPGLGCGLRIDPAVVPGTVSPGRSQQGFQRRSAQRRIRYRNQDRGNAVALAGQVTLDVLAAGHAGCHYCGCCDDLIGEELPSQQPGTVPDLQEDPFQDFAALADGLACEIIQKVQGAVAAERAGPKGSHVSLPIKTAAARSTLVH